MFAKCFRFASSISFCSRSFSFFSLLILCILERMKTKISVTAGKSCTSINFARYTYSSELTGWNSTDCSEYSRRLRKHCLITHFWRISYVDLKYSPSRTPSIEVFFDMMPTEAANLVGDVTSSVFEKDEVPKELLS